MMPGERAYMTASIFMQVKASEMPTTDSLNCGLGVLMNMDLVKGALLLKNAVA